MCAFLSSCFANFPDVEDLPVVEDYPDPLVMFDGTAVRALPQWKTLRRLELISLFEHYMYGKAPQAPDNFAFTIENVDKKALNGKATRKIITLRFGPAATPPVSLLLVVPNEPNAPVPVMLGLNFAGNHTTMNDDDIPLTTAWINDKYTGAKDSKAHENQRGIRSQSGTHPRWQIERAIDRGYAVATIYAGEITPDRPTGDYPFTDGVHRGYMEKGQTRPKDHQWAAIASWAWGLQRGADYLVQDEDIDKDRIIVFGHSRLGKAALLAGAFDQRFAMVIPSQAGCGGTSPSRSDVGESVEAINNNFPHWFNDTFKKFGSQVKRLPFDQHCLIALVAPRPILLSNAVEDEWADPKGQFQMLVEAASVYEFYGIEKPLKTTEFPKVNELIDSTLGFFIRPGKHDVTAADWDAWLNFADKNLKAEN